MAPKREFRTNLTPEQRQEVARTVKESTVINDFAASYVLGELTRDDLMQEIERVERIAECMVMGVPVDYGY